MLGTAHRSFRRARVFVMRSMALSVLVFAMPSTKQVVENVLAIADGIASAEEDCSDDCGKKSSSAPKPCQHCSCCAPRTILPPVVIAPPPTQVGFVLERAIPGHALSSGFRAPPFRPPAV